MLLVDERLHDPYGTCSLPTNNCTIRIYNNAFLPMLLALEIASWLSEENLPMGSR
jgi:hypothetical protein